MGQQAYTAPYPALLQSQERGRHDLERSHSQWTGTFVHGGSLLHARVHSHLCKPCVDGFYNPWHVLSLPEHIADIIADIIPCLLNEQPVSWADLQMKSANYCSPAILKSSVMPAGTCLDRRSKHLHNAPRRQRRRQLGWTWRGRLAGNLNSRRSWCSTAVGGMWMG